MPKWVYAILGIFCIIITGAALPLLIGKGVYCGPNQTQKDFSILKTALAIYYLDHNTYPKNLGALITTTGHNNNPYLKERLFNEWGHPYSYLTGQNPEAYALIDLGKDNHTGGQKENKDIAYDPKSLLQQTHPQNKVAQ